MVENETEKETIYLGAILKQHRESQNVSINQVANQLHLDNRVITAIENDDHDGLPDPIYVRGYIRSYCKFLKLDTEEMLQLYKENVHRDDPEIIPEIKYPTQSSSSDKPVKAFTYLISLGLVLLVITWWQSNFIVSNPATSQPDTTGSTTSEQNVTDIQPVEPLEEIDLGEYLPVSGELQTSPTDLAISPGTGETLVLDPFNLPDENNVEVDEQIIEDISEHFIPESNFESGLSSSSDTIQSDEPDTDEEESNYVPSTGPDELELTLTADSWIEIFDVNEQKVYFDLGRTGEQLTLFGTAPFDILLGFAQGVSIEYNGEPVDQAPFTRAGVARFTLGE